MKKLNDKELEKVDGGSTRIVLFSQTFEGKAKRTGRNTIAVNSPFSKTTSYKLPNLKKTSSKSTSTKNKRKK